MTFDTLATNATTTTAATKGSAQKADPNRVVRIWRTDQYPIQQWYMLGIFMFLVTAAYLIQLTYAWNVKRLAKNAGQDTKGEVLKATINNKFSLRRIPLAFLNVWRIILYRFTFPLGGGRQMNGAEMIIISSYIVAMFVWTFINTRNLTTGKNLDPGYYGNRAGNIAVYQFPLIVLLAGKTNLISLITGLSYEKLNLLHRVSARIGFVLTLIHAYGRAVLGLSGSSAVSLWWMAIGVAGTVTWGLVFIMFRPVRAKCYEFFVIMHFVLILFTIIASYYHTIEGGGEGNIFIPTFLFWALDRVIRIARVGWNHFRSSSSGVKAYAEVLDDEVVRLTLRRKISWIAGQNFLISVPAVSSIPVEAHPFTVANISGDRSLSGFTTEPTAGENDMVFFLKAKGGFTKKLMTAVTKKKGENGGEVQLPIYLDGPYGTPPDVNTHSKVILIAGGSGITYTLPVLQEIVKNVRENNTLCREVLFIWAVPHPSQFSWVTSPLRAALDEAPANLRIRILLHATRNNELDSVDSFDEKDPRSPDSEKKHSWMHTEGITTKTGRPDLRAIVTEEIQATSGNICISAAGPSAMANDIRAGARFNTAGPTAILRGGASVTVHIESFVLA